jgi:hypothetical protein
VQQHSRRRGDSPPAPQAFAQLRCKREAANGKITRTKPRRTLAMLVR